MDRRTKRQKLQAMALQTVSPEEAAIAKKKLAEMGPETFIEFDQVIFHFPRPSGYTGDDVIFRGKPGATYVTFTMNFTNMTASYNNMTATPTKK